MKIEVGNVYKWNYPFLGRFVVVLDVKTMRDDDVRISVLTQDGIQVIITACDWFEEI